MFPMHIFNWTITKCQFVCFPSVFLFSKIVPLVLAGLKSVWIQWNLDLRKFLGVTKIFLKSRFFLISNTRKPLKKHNFESEHLKQYKCCIALSLSNASYYICRYSHSLIRKIWKYLFWKLKNCSKIVKKIL